MSYDIIRNQTEFGLSFAAGSVRFDPNKLRARNSSCEILISASGNYSPNSLPVLES